MATPAKHPPSFSPGRRWKIAFDVLLRTALVLAVIVMVNYLGAQFYQRFYLSSQTRMALSARSLKVVHSITNDINVTLYYDKSAEIFPALTALLNEYHAANPKISVKLVDYKLDPGEAEKVKMQYKLSTLQDKDLVIFDCEGRVKIANGKDLVQYAPTGKSPDGKLEFSIVGFNGERLFTAMLLSVTNPKPLKAYILQGHGCPPIDGNDDQGYLKFGEILAQSYIATVPLQLLGDASVPDDCNLLIIAGPQTAFSEMELKKIDQYLKQGGRLFALLDFSSISRPTGLESILAGWGVIVAAAEVQDFKNTTSPDGRDIIVSNFSKHPVVNSLTALQLILPRPVGRIEVQSPPADAPVVEAIAFSSATATLANNSAEPSRSYPLMVAVEQKSIAGVGNTRGSTRMIVVGDSFFLGNHNIEGGANRDFVGYAANWLLDRPLLLDAIGPRKVNEFRLTMTASQQQQSRWLLLGALPGAILLFGLFVWFVRRK
jgi:hypothetical protein